MKNWAKMNLIPVIYAFAVCAGCFGVGLHFGAQCPRKTKPTSDKYFISYAYTSEQGVGFGNITSSVVPKDVNDLDYIAEKAKLELGLKDFAILSWQKFEQ